MKNSISFIMLLIIVMFHSSCLYDKGELAQPVSGCDTSFYRLEIKPVIDNNCATAGCHVPGGSGTGDFTTYASTKNRLPNPIKTRINIADVNNPLHMPQGVILPADDLAKLNTWIDEGFPGCD